MFSGECLCGNTDQPGILAALELWYEKSREEAALLRSNAAAVRALLDVVYALTPEERRRLEADKLMMNQFSMIFS